MKLIFCKKCQDVIKMQRENRTCLCGESSGYYEDSLNAFYSGAEAIPLGFNNSSLANALRNIPESGRGYEFDAFVIPKQCETFKKI